MEEESRNVQVPIKAILEQNVSINGCKYPEDEFNMLRKYFIACLNLGYIEPSNLNLMVSKFCSEVKFIVTNYNSYNKLDCYQINNGVLYLSGSIKDNNIMIYEINLYKAACEVIFKSNDKHLGISNAICYMAAEKIYNMDENESRIILPRTNTEIINGKTHKFRSGYSNYDEPITLLKELLICKDVMENQVIKKMFNDGYEDTMKGIFKTSNDDLVLTVLDRIATMYIKRRMKNEADPKEDELINKYQIIVNSMFNNKSQYYFAFCALVTTDELRNDFISKISDEE